MSAQKRKSFHSLFSMHYFPFIISHFFFPGSNMDTRSGTGSGTGSGIGSGVGSGTGSGTSGNSGNKSSSNTGGSSREGQEDGSMYKGSEFNAKQVRLIFFECIVAIICHND